MSVRVTASGGTARRYRSAFLSLSQESLPDIVIKKLAEHRPQQQNGLQVRLFCMPITRSAELRWI